LLSSYRVLGTVLGDGDTVGPMTTWWKETLSCRPVSLEGTEWPGLCSLQDLNLALAERNVSLGGVSGAETSESKASSRGGHTAWALSQRHSPHPFLEGAAVWSGSTQPCLLLCVGYQLWRPSQWHNSF
jgi:hypothetical protein